MPARPAWPLLLAAVLVALQCWPGVAEALRFDRTRFEQGAWWLALSAQFVHLSLAHAGANAAALLALSWLLPQRAAGALGPALAGGCVGVALVVVLDPGCRYYAGASGALHGGFAALPSWIWGLLLLKIALEALQWLPSPWPFPVYWPAHLAGAAGGLLAVLASSAALALRRDAQQRQ